MSVPEKLMTIDEVKARHARFEYKSGAYEAVAFLLAEVERLPNAVFDRDQTIGITEARAEKAERDLREAAHMRDLCATALNIIAPGGRRLQMFQDSDCPVPGMPMFGVVSLVSPAIIADEPEGENDSFPGAHAVHCWTYDEDTQHEPELCHQGYFVTEDWLCKFEAALEKQHAEATAMRFRQLEDSMEHGRKYIHELKERTEKAERHLSFACDEKDRIADERDARPDISAEDAALWLAYDPEEDGEDEPNERARSDASERVYASLRTHAAKAAVPSGGCS